MALGITSDIFDARVQCFFEGLFNGLKREGGEGPDLYLNVREGMGNRQSLADILDRVGYQNATILPYQQAQETQWLRNVILVQNAGDAPLEFLVGKDPLGHPIFQIENLAQFKQAKVKLQNCAFRAGNVLEGDDFFLFGEDLRQAGTGFPECIGFPSDKEQIFVGRQPSEPGLSWQPVFDLDMFLSLAGRIEKGKDKGKYLLLLARPVPFAGSLPPGSEASDFDAVAEQLLESHGDKFVIERIPLLYIDAELQGTLMRWIMDWSSFNSTMDQSAKSAAIWLTYNNVLAEVTPNEKRVWMPTYDIPDAFCSGFSRSIPPRAVANMLALTKDLDAESHSIWAGVAGFAVEKMGPMNIWADQLGAIRCLSTELRRS